MKLVLKTTVIDRILKDIAAAKAQGREPDYIVLTEAEMKELDRDTRSYNYVESDLMKTFAHYAEGKVTDTVKYDVRDFDIRPEFSTNRSYDRYQRYRAVTTSRFQGVPLFVVPKEYQPL